MSVALTALGCSVVRILGQDKTYAGLGYRAGPELVITCAHVVANALRTDPHDPKPPPGEVLLDVPFALGHESEVPVRANVVPTGWIPSAEGSRLSDLALLRVVDTATRLPLPGPLADLDPAISLRGKPFEAYGGPESYEKNLIHLIGEVGACLANGRWQLSVQLPGFLIRPGCSGAPAVDSRTGQIIGLIAQDEQDPEAQTGFLIPAAHLRALLAASGLTRPVPPAFQALRDWVDANLGRTVPALADRVRRFVNHYTGVRDQPMPFVGREGPLAELDRRFAEGGGAFQLVSGPAGLGKSALLLHWMARRLREDPTLRLLFLPVSIGFDTAEERTGLQLLHAQLAGLFAELAFSEGFKPNPKHYRDRIADGWQAIVRRPDERFLLVVDGADEASGTWLAQVLPYEIPANLTLVLAARHHLGQSDGRDWLDEFPVAPECRVADPLELAPLARAAVGEAIIQLGHSFDAVLGREGVLDALYDLTDRGDPLLVGLWAKQLWKSRGQAKGLNPAGLARLRPSYGGFVEVWLDEQRKVWGAGGIEADAQTLRRLLRILALARGPLRLRDWLAVARCLPFELTWDGETARKVLDSAYRLVVGDAESGYAFVHPRLADHFQAELDDIKDERQAVPRAFVKWGAATVTDLDAGLLTPDQCPSYLLRHYSAHVLAAGEPPDLDRHLLPLLGEGWMLAWEEEGGVYSGYAMDIQRVQETLRKSNARRKGPPYRIGGEIRCALIRSSIRSLAERLQPDLIVMLAASGRWTIERAIRVANDLPEPVNRTYALALLAKLALATDRSRRQAISLALDAARQIEDQSMRASMLAVVPSHWAGEPALLGKALAIAHDIGDENCRAEAMAAVATQLALEPAFSGEALADLAQQVAVEPTLLDEALAALAALAAVRGMREERLRIDPEYRWICANIPPDAVEEALATPLMLEPTRLDEAKQAARILAYRIEEDQGLRVDVLVALAGQLAGEERSVVLGEALAIARGSDSVSGWNSAAALRSIAAQLPDDPALLREMLAIAPSIEDDRSRADVLVAVTGQSAGQPVLLREVLKITRGIVLNSPQADVLAAVAGQSAGDPALLREVLEIAGSIKRNKRAVSYTHIIETVAGQLGEKERRALLGDALTAAGEITFERPPADAPAAVAGQSTQGSAAELGESLNATSVSEYFSVSSDIDRGSNLPRDECLEIVKRLTPAIARLGGITAVHETVDAIRDVGRWWP